MNLVGNRAVLQASLVLAALGLAGSWAPSQASPAGEEAAYRILVTNDDGIDSPGLAELVKALRPLGEVTIVAPLKNQSGISHALNLRDPIFVDQRVVAGQSATALTATPVTCVRVAIDQLLEGKRPDLIVSGVNRGLNFGRNTYISGTVAAAREAALQGIPAIAVSLAIEAHPNYAEAAEMAAEVAGIVKANGLPAGVFLNVNVPRPPARRLRLTRQSRLAGAEHFDPRQTPYGRPYFWSYFEQPTAAGEAGSDVEAVRAGFVAVTPLHASESDESAIELLADFFPPTVRSDPTGILGSHPSEP
ncbi:MAG: 5'/3'-nucleotidase SurE [Thermoanaerobaculia bacterium]